jgi:anaerobic selenocysteine-containing dehydrogenase
MARPLLADHPAPDRLVMVGRRQLRSNNSWMHNIPMLSGGSNRCTLLINPSDAHRIGVADGDNACVRTETGSVVSVVAVTDDVPLGIVCMPHGWGHSLHDAWGATARERPGANMNTLVSSVAVDELSGTAVLAGMPVEVTLASADA